MENNVFKDVHKWLDCVKTKPVGKEEKLKQARNARKLIDEELDELEEAIQNEDREEELNALMDAEWCLHNISWMCGMTKKEYNEEKWRVYRSNYSKFCITIEEAEKSVELYSIGEHPNKIGEVVDAYYRETGNSYYPYVVLRKGDDKILKSFMFKDVNEF